MKKDIIIGLFLIVVFTAVLGWFFIYFKPTHLRKDPLKQASLVTNAPSLVQEFFNNKALANQKYNNQSIKVTGIVKLVHTDSTGTTIYLDANHTTSGVFCRLKNATTNIVSGDNVAIIGFFKGFLVDVQLAEAVVVKKIASKQQPTTTIQKIDTNNNITTNTTTAKNNKIIFGTKTANIKFFSKNSAENIVATNNQVSSSFVSESGEINFIALIKSFRFSNEIMQEHFNSNEYMQSDIYPKAEFNGSISNLQNIHFATNGSYTAIVDGILNLHGVSKKIQTSGTIHVKNNTLIINANFKIVLADYKIKSWDNNVKLVDIDLNAFYK